MPTQVAREATEFFGSNLLPFVNDLVKTADSNKSYFDLVKEGVAKEITGYFFKRLDIRRIIFVKYK